MSRAKLSQLSTRLSHVEGKNGGGLLAMVSWNAPGMEPGQWSCQSTRGDCAGTPAEVMQFLDDAGTLFCDNGRASIIALKEAHATPEDVLKLFEGDAQE